MCALFRDRKPDDENGNPATAKSRQIRAAADLQRTTMWQLVGGLPTGHVWSLR